ncbi:TPR-like protein [Fomitiporia mediterranea MF3/22]|uniref:TPR-like protein n=1 Tax=Fomitiporia mediterranea (strain MF3/22) TaxID=694068 RepID=UPI0004408E58|nr:TPR-like protein [Fomitiporia mediterranea MF3/22]EJD03103.1 TPR-like protein [Fomitiporia mediterranea MF3/22]
MSLQGLISGSECALPNNPLAQVLKHTDGDRSVQRDRIAGPSSSRLQHLPSTASNNVSEGDMSMARHFFDAAEPELHSGMQPSHARALEFAHRMQMTRGPIPQAQDQTQPSANMQDLWKQAEIHNFSHASQSLQGASSSVWSSEFSSSASGHPMSLSQASLPQASATIDTAQNAYTSSSFYRPMGYGTGMYNSSFPQSFSPVQEQGKGKGKARDDAFEAAFAQFSIEAPPQAKIEEVHEDSTNQERASTRNDKPAEVEDIMNRFQETMQNSNGDAATWEAELQSFLQSQREDTDFDYGATLREAWENGVGQYDGDSMAGAMKFDDEGVPVLGPYVFEGENWNLTNLDATSCLSQAKRLLAENGSLTEAALLLEAAIQKGELGEGGYEAWILLGETRCMDEREEAGMRALVEGSRRAAEAGERGVGLLSLATAFTNEGYERGSHAMLLRWLTARYPEHSPSAEDAAEWLRQSHWASRERVTDAFLAVARAQHSAGVVDADVQVGLGVLFYTNGDFERAKDCFAAALAINPRDYLLWNRYGSALSNGNKPEEALGAYREALQLRPTYTRAIYNVGVACLNIGADKEAAEHFLSALSMQESPSGDKSEQLWFTLRRALLSMGREDLASRAHSGGDVSAFRAEGFEF